MNKYFFLHLHFYLFLLIIIRLAANTDQQRDSSIIAADDPNISNLNVAHYDCSIQNNLRQFSITQVKPCTQAPSGLESTRAIAKVYVRAKAKRIKAWQCISRIKQEKFICSQTDVKWRRQDKTHYHQNTLETFKTLDANEGKKSNTPPQWNRQNILKHQRC